MGIASMLLFALSLVVIQLFRMYQAGGEVRRTQESARTVIESISRVARDSAMQRVQTSAGAIKHDRLCLYGTPNPDGTAKVNVYEDVQEGNVYRLYHQVFDSVAVTTCPATANGTRTALGSSDVSFYEFRATAPAPGAPGDQLLQVTLRVAATSALDLIPAGGTTCADNAMASYCSITSLQTSVTLRGLES